MRTPRLLLSGVASTGALETGMLTYSKIFSSPIFGGLCTEQSCTDVLSSSYSVIPGLNVPLVSLAFVGYSTIAYLAIQSSLQSERITRGEKLGNDPSSSIILFLSTAMATFSGYLMAVLKLVLHADCTYCYLSAGLSFAMAAIAWNSKIVSNATKAFTVASTSAATTALASAFLFYMTGALTAPEEAQASTAVAAQILAQQASAEAVQKKAPPVITTNSSPRAMQLAERLKAADAKMFGAYWCSHCYNQKQVLGEQAFESLPYIECDKEGVDSQYNLCRQKKVPGYPTWEINGKLFPGEQSLKELEDILAKSTQP